MSVTWKRNWRGGKMLGKANNNMSLQETTDKELDSQRLEFDLEKRKIPVGNNNEDVEDINVGEDDMSGCLQLSLKMV